MSRNLNIGVDINMTLFCLFATFTSPAWAMWVTKHFLIRFRSYFPELQPRTRIWKHHLLISFCCSFDRKLKFFRLKCCMSSQITAPLRSNASQNFLTSSSGSLLIICSGFLFSLSANNRDTGTYSFSNSRLALAFRHLSASNSASKSYTMV